MDEKERQQILERRAENQKMALRIEQGARYFECVKVFGTDGKEHEVRVYALSDDEFGAAFEEAGVDPRDIGNKEKLVQNLKFLRIIARAATGDANITANILANESGKIMMKAFELSRLMPAKVESFREGNIQP